MVTSLTATEKSSKCPGGLLWRPATVVVVTVGFFEPTLKSVINLVELTV